MDNCIFSSHSEHVVCMSMCCGSGDAGTGVVVSGAAEHCDAVDEALRYLAISMFSRVHFSLGKSHFYKLKDDQLGAWAERTNFSFERGFFLWSLLEWI